MKTRRGFLQAGSFAIASQFAPLSLHGQQQPPLEKPYVRDYWNDFPNYLSSAVNAARARRKSDLSKIKTRQQADERAAFVRRNVWELVGGPLEKTPLNPKTTGVVERDATASKNSYSNLSRSSTHRRIYTYRKRERGRSLPSFLRLAIRMMASCSAAIK
jgi:hypothetical protein